MSAFVGKEKVPVTIDGQNVIYIRPKMTLGMQTRITDGLKMHYNGNGGGVSLGIGEGEALMLLLGETVIGWEGPDFKDEGGELLPCNRVTLENMDPDYPLFGEVTERVKDLYAKATEGSSPNLLKPKRTGRSTSRR